MLKRTKLFFTLTTALGMAAVLTVVVNTRTLSASMRRLNQSNQALRTSDRFAARGIEQVFGRQDELMLILARQSQPRPEWTYLIENLTTSLTEFADEPRHREALPHHTAKANLYLGRLLFMNGSNMDALHRITRSIELASSIGDLVTSGEARNTLGCIHTTFGNYQLASESIQAACRDLGQLPGQEIVLALAYSNAGLIERAQQRDGTDSIRTAINILQRSDEVHRYGTTGELLLDLQMTLCEMLWSQGLLEEAMQLTRETHQQLVTNYHADVVPNLDKLIVAPNRYAKAIRYADQNLRELEQLLTSSPDVENRDQLGATASRWQWHRLVDLVTERVSNDLAIHGTMTAEFETQSGLILAWGMFEWTNDIVVEIVKHTYDRSQLVIVVDNDDSLDEAQAALDASDVPLERIQFATIDIETPWFRDDGPIASISPSGDPIWFDSRLTRDRRRRRTVVDALPSMIRRTWRTRVADVPIHVEGGMLLSNGKGIAIGSKAITAYNRDFGFSDQTIERELRRITGADQMLLVDTLIGEKTNHIDLFIAFTDANTVVVSQSEDRNDPNAKILDRAAELLGTLKSGGKNLRVVRIPIPESDGDSFPSYTNVVFANGMLLVPSYAGEANREREAAVRDIYQRLLPGWQIQFIDCTRLRQRGGALHCLVSNLGPSRFAPVFLKKLQ